MRTFLRGSEWVSLSASKCIPEFLWWDWGKFYKTSIRMTRANTIGKRFANRCSLSLNVLSPHLTSVLRHPPSYLCFAVILTSTLYPPPYIFPSLLPPSLSRFSLPQSSRLRFAFIHPQVPTSTSPWLILIFTVKLGVHCLVRVRSVLSFTDRPLEVEHLFVSPVEDCSEASTRHHY